jgi:hypothetical protein
MERKRKRMRTRSKQAGTNTSMSKLWAVPRDFLPSVKGLINKTVYLLGYYRKERRERANITFEPSVCIPFTNEPSVSVRKSVNYNNWKVRYGRKFSHK